MKSGLSRGAAASNAAFNKGAERFSRSRHTMGPHPIPRPRQIANQFHRIFSVKAGMRLVECESGLEADAIFWAEGRPEIKVLCEQPLRIHGAVGHKPYHTMDLMLGFEGGRSTYYEVKPDSRLTVQEDGERTPANWSTIRSWFAANGMLCDVITDETLLPDAQLIGNWRMLLPFAVHSYREPDPRLETSLVHMIASHAVNSIADVHDRLPEVPEQELTGHLAKLLHRGELSADLNWRAVSPSTPLVVAGARRA